MTEYTDEQKAEISKMLAEVRAAEQWGIAGDQFFREALLAVSAKVQQGIYDPYILNVGKVLYDNFRKANSIQPQPSQEQKDEVPNKD